jgi:hypothetical protein
MHLTRDCGERRRIDMRAITFTISRPSSLALFIASMLDLPVVTMSSTIVKISINKN